MRILSVLLFLVLPLKAFAGNGRAYAIFNTSTSFADNGSVNDIGARIEANMEREGYGIGGEYKFNLPFKKVIPEAYGQTHLKNVFVSVLAKIRAIPLLWSANFFIHLQV